jgi:hypothetical protein
MANQKTERVEVYKRLLKHMSMSNVEELFKQYVQNPSFAELDKRLEEDCFHNAIALDNEEREGNNDTDFYLEKYYADYYATQGDQAQVSYWRIVKNNRLLAESKGEQT